MAEQDQATGATGQDPNTPLLVLQKMYIKDCSFEAPNSPGVFQGKWEPQIVLNLNTTTSKLAPDTQEIVLAITLEAKIGESTAFLIELEQAGIFTIRNFPADQLKPLIAKRCPSMLYPYVRETVSDLVTKGGFPQLLLQPMDFDELYSKANVEQQAGQTAAAEGSD